MSNGRIPSPRPSELDSARRRLYEQITGGPRSSGPQLFQIADEDGRLQGPFNAMLLAPAVGEPLQRLGSAIRYESRLTDRAREIAILVLASERLSDFEWYAHRAVGRHVGLSESELEALRIGSLSESFDRQEQLVRSVVLELVRSRGITDDTFTDAKAVLGLELMMELVILVGYYDLLDLSMRVWQTPLPKGVQSPFGPDGRHSMQSSEGDTSS